MDREVMLITRAVQLRKKLGVDSDSPIDLFSIVQAIEGLTLVFYPMSKNLSGLCIRGKEGRAVIAVNSSMTLGRQRFSLAHELYHLYYDKNIASVSSQEIGSGSAFEKEADAFASYFLIPPASLQSRVDILRSQQPDNRLHLQDVIRIEQYYGVSHKAALIRLKQDKFLAPSEAENMMGSGVLQTAEKMGFAPDLYKPLPDGQQYKTYGHYIDQASDVFEKELVSEGKYEELLLSAFRFDLVYGDEDSEDVVD